MIRHFTGSGISITAGGATGFMITRTTVFSNGNGATGTGINIPPPAGGTSKGVIDRVIADRHTVGISGNATGGNVNVNIHDSVATSSALAGIVATGGSGAANVMVMRSTASNNTTGIQNNGGNAVVRIGESAIQGNVNGVAGSVASYGTNQLDGNSSNGTVTSTPLK